MAKKKHTRIVTEPDGTKVELDYSFKAFWEATINNPPEKLRQALGAAVTQRKRLRCAKEIAVRREI